MTIRPCPACGNYLAMPVTKVSLVTPDGHPLQGGYHVVSCVTCGTGFADCEPPTDWYDSFYGESAKYASEEPTAWQGQRAVLTVDRIIERCHLEQGARVVDIGSGNGLIVDELRDRGFDAVGIDPSGANGALVGSLAKMPEDVGTYDAVLLIGVLEHVWDVAGAMSTVNSLLNQDGSVYVEVPDAAAYVTSYLGPFEDFNTEHVNHFAAESLRVLGDKMMFDTFTESMAIPFAPGLTAQCLVNVWERRSRPDLWRTLRDYADQSNVDMVCINVTLDRELGDATSFNLWGAGECAYRFLSLPTLKDRTCELIVDSDQARRAGRLLGMEIMSPVALLANSAPIVLASTTRSAGIVAAAKELGVSERIVTVAA